jgi:hypothetical protein
MLCKGSMPRLIPTWSRTLCCLTIAAACTLNVELQAGEISEPAQVSQARCLLPFLPEIGALYGVVLLGDELLVAAKEGYFAVNLNSLQLTKIEGARPTSDSEMYAAGGDEVLIRTGGKLFRYDRSGREILPLPIPGGDAVDDERAAHPILGRGLLLSGDFRILTYDSITHAVWRFPLAAEQTGQIEGEHILPTGEVLIAFANGWYIFKSLNQYEYVGYVPKTRGTRILPNGDLLIIHQEGADRFDRKRGRIVSLQAKIGDAYSAHVLNDKLALIQAEYRWFLLSLSNYTISETKIEERELRHIIKLEGDNVLVAFHGGVYQFPTQTNLDPRALGDIHNIYALSPSVHLVVSSNGLYSV